MYNDRYTYYNTTERNFPDMTLRRMFSLCTAAMLAAATFTSCDDTPDESSVVTVLQQDSITDATTTTTTTEFTTADTTDATTSTTQASSDTTQSGTESTSTTTEETTTTTTTTTTTAIIAPLVDTEPPILLNGGWGTKILKGTEFVLDKYVGFADFYDATPTLSYTGTVNTEVCGTYPITAIITDDAGNAYSWKLNITVVESMPSGGGGGSSPRLSFDSFMAKHTEEGIRFGIDVSRWQEDVDFEAVKAAGCSFVIMRIGYYYDEINMDEYYQQNIAAAKAAGLDVGVYLYTIANTREEIKANAAWIAEQLDGMQLDFPVAFDWERFGHFQEFEMSIRDLNELYILFDEEMQRYGYSTMLYSSKNYLENFWYVQEDYPVWLAHYTSETDYTGDYMLWQRSCVGRIDGIAGDVDFNILYESEYRKHFGNS